MADEAFALSPISARAELPSEADYDAIREAFMETARGRWFLGEYGKRNRNADTGMVLDAVARIEATIAAHRQAPANELPDALVLIRGLLSDAKATAAQMMSGPDAEAALAAVNKGTRIIREIAWTLREYGTDSRICDMLDAQVNAIEASHHHTMATNKRDAVLTTFDHLIRRIGELGGSGMPPWSEADTAASPASPDVDNAAPAETAGAAEAGVPLYETASEAAAAAMPDAATHDTPAPEVSAPALEASAQAAAHAPDTPEAPAAAVMPSPAEFAPAESPQQEVIAVADAEAEALDLETAQDLAVLEAVAQEMAEPEIAGATVAEPIVEPGADTLHSVSFDMIASDLVEHGIVEPVVAEPVVAEPVVAEPVVAEPVVAEPVVAEPVVAKPVIVKPAIVRLPMVKLVESVIVEQASETTIVPEPEPVMPSQPSLGATLIASGIVSRSSAAHDALAPIRRMSQAERIAFFS